MLYFIKTLHHYSKSPISQSLKGHSWACDDQGSHLTSTVNVAAAMNRPSGLRAAPWFVRPPVSMDARCTPRALLTFKSVFAPQLRTTPTLAFSTQALAALSAAPPPCSASICKGPSHTQHMSQLS